MTRRGDTTLGDPTLGDPTLEDTVTRTPGSRPPVTFAPRAAAPACRTGAKGFGRVRSCGVKYFQAGICGWFAVDCYVTGSWGP